MSRIEEIEARLAGRSEKLIVIDTGYAWQIVAEGFGTLADMRIYPGNGDDALLLALAPTDIRYLLAEVKRLREALERIADAPAVGGASLHYRELCLRVRNARAALSDEGRGT